MKAGTLAAAAIAIAVAAPATAAAQPAPSEETTAKAAACLQEALATKTGLPPEEFRSMAAVVVESNLVDKPALESLGLLGLLRMDVCPSGWGRAIADRETADWWIAASLLAQGLEEILNWAAAPADSEADAGGTVPPP